MLSKVVVLAGWGMLVWVGSVFAQQASVPARQPGMLGVQMHDLSKEEAEKLGFGQPAGVWIDKVEEGSPAEKAGIKPADVILSVDGVELGSYRQFREVVGAKGAGTEVTFRLLRQGRVSTVAATLAPRSQALAQTDEFDALSQQVEMLYRQGKYAEAAAAAEHALALAEQRVGAIHPAVATALNNLANVDEAMGQYAEAIALQTRSLSIREKVFGPDHADVASSLNNLAIAYQRQGRSADAVPLLARALAIRERLLGAEHPLVAGTLNNLAGAYAAQGRYPEATQLYTRALAIKEKALGPDDPEVAGTLSNLAETSNDQGRHADAIPLLNRALAIQEKTLGVDHPDVAQTLHSLAETYRFLERGSEAIPLYTQALAIQEKTLGPDHPFVAATLDDLGSVYASLDRHADAIQLHNRALTILEKALGPDHPDVALTLNNLGRAYRSLGHYAEAAPLFMRALAIQEKALGPEHPQVAETVGDLANVYSAQHRYLETIPLFTRALAIQEKALGPDHPRVAQTLNDLAAVYDEQERYVEAIPLYDRALAIWNKALGPEHPDVAQTLNNLANVYAAQGRFTEAIPLWSRALAITEKAFGPDHPDVALQESNLGLDDMKRADWASALRHLRRAADIQAKRAVVAARDEASVTNVQPADRYAFVNLTTAAWRVSRAEPRQRADLARETFETAQQAAASNAGHALEQMAVRFSTGNAALAGRLRAKQDLIGQWQALNKALIAAASAIAGKRDEAQIAKLRQDLAGIDKQLEDIDRSLARDFPAYSELTSPSPVAVAEVQKLLADEEALLLTLDTPGGKLAPAETFVWVVTKTKVHWVRSDLGAASLQREVAALRCGLDYAGSWAVENSPCPALTNTSYTDRDNAVGKPLPFDPTRAHALYKSLFGGLTDALRGRRLIVVASGALTQLPFQVLVTETPDPKLKGTEALRRARWLIRDHAITVLPSVTAFKALRELAKDSHATRPLIGFGNPLLDGGPDDAERAYWARQNATCPVAVASVSGLGRGVKQIATRGAPTEVAAQLRAAPPLPETADELCAVAKDLHVAASDIHIGAHATLPEVGRLSSAGELAQYHIIHFATHGAMSGQITDNAEPGLILTPPETPSAEDDGYLSASRIASLKLDADWVILSACNTAAGGANSAEALSGLARAFFYAGARALLVSHWSVNSVATVRLVTGAIGRMTANNKLGRAEALRQSMLSVIDTGSDVGAHPATWAPFVVVGEGAASK